MENIFSDSTNFFMKNSLTETATGSVIKKMFLKISQYSQEDICIGVSFLIKLNFY